MNPKHRIWTKSDIEQLQLLFKTHTRAEIAAITGRTSGAIKSKVREQNIKLSADELYQKHQLHKHMGAAGYFKKGQLPPNTKHNSKVSIRTDTKGRKTFYVKISHGKWQEVHKAVWQKANGPIPKKHVLRFLDGNTLNPSLENLELIPMSLNMLHNSLHNFHPEVAKTYDVINTLKKEINERKKFTRRS